MSTARRAFSLTVVTVLLAALLAPSQALGAPGAPVLSPIQAEAAGTTTFYSIVAEDPDNDPLTYLWSKSNERDCGEFDFSGAEAFWDHPHPPCPAESMHPGTITVVVSDGESECIAEYPFGSQPGVGPDPESCGVDPSPTPSPSPSPTPTPSPSPQPSPSPTGPPDGTSISFPEFNLPMEPPRNPAGVCKGVEDAGVLIAIDEPQICPLEETALLAGPDISQDTGPDPVYLHSGEFYTTAVDLEIPGRGFDWRFQRKYRSGITLDGPLGFNWEFNYNARLTVVDDANLLEIRSTFPQAAIGDVARSDGNSRADLYVLDGGDYVAPPGVYASLNQALDGSFVERGRHGTVVRYGVPDAGGIARMASLSDRNENTMSFEYDAAGRLSRVIDTLGRPIVYRYDGEDRLREVEDFTGRTISFAYDGDGNLRSVTGPAVTGTPTGNDFPQGKTVRYDYTQGGSRNVLAHNLTAITAPKEVAAGGPPRVRISYDNEDRVRELSVGGTNDSGIPAGGTITYLYEELQLPGNGSQGAASRTTVTDRNGNDSSYTFNQVGNILSIEEATNREIRPGDPAMYEHRFDYNDDSERLGAVGAEGNRVVRTFEATALDPLARGNLLNTSMEADPARGGDQSEISTSFRYEPIYNLLRSMTDPRGNDPDYEPQNGGRHSRGRYTTKYTFDYQEGTRYKALARKSGRTASEVKRLLTQAGVPMGLGDVNGDGSISQMNGNVVRITHPSVRLQAACPRGFAIPRRDPECSLQAVREGTRSQRIVELLTYNRFGQLTRQVDPEGNVTLTSYHPGNDPDGDGQDLIAGAPTDGVGYLRERISDARDGARRNSRTDPPATSIRRRYGYDPVGNVVREIDGRGIATDHVVNQLNQRVQTVRASAHGLFQTDPGEPESLIDFAYLTRRFFDANDNIVKEQTEDRGNTSVVGGDNGGSGTAFVDTVFHFDILDQRVQASQEVSDSEDLVTRYRYDRNGNRVLTIDPEGNATSSVFDERDFLYRETKGATSPPGSALMGASDPTGFSIRGGISSSEWFRYDANGNLIERSDAADTDSASGNNATFAPGDRTLYRYDGFDRRTSEIDPVGTQTILQYDPSGNVVQESVFGSTGRDDNAGTAVSGPVSSGGVIQESGLVSRVLIKSMRSSYDEADRPIATADALFVDTITTERSPNLRDGAADIGKSTASDRRGCAPRGAPEPPSGYLGCVTTRVEYDRNSRETFGIDADGDVTATFYDGADRPIKLRDAEGNIVRTAYDDNGNAIETLEVDRSQVEGVPKERFLTTTFYDSLDRAERVVDNLGRSTDRRWDSRDQLVAISDASGPMAGVSIRRRAFRGGPHTRNEINGFGNVTRFHYDGLGRRLREETVLTSSGLGDGTHIGADRFGVKGEVPQADPSQGGGDGLITIGEVFDGNSLTTARVDDQGNVTLYLYDDLNRRVSEIKGITADTPLTYQRLFGSRRIVTPTVATLNSPAAILQSQVGAQLSAASARLSSVASFFPALADRVDDDPPDALVYGWDEDGNLLLFEDGNDTEVFLKFDAADRLIAERVFRGGRSDVHAGDPAFAPAPTSDPSHVGGSVPNIVGTTKVDYEYNGLNLQTRLTDNNEPATTDDDSTVLLAYDSLGRRIEESERIGEGAAMATSVALRGEGLVSKMTYPDNRKIVLRYDDLDRVVRIKDAGSSPALAAYTYIGRQRVLERRYPSNGTRMTYLNKNRDKTLGYDGTRHPVQARHLRGRSLLVGFRHGFDRADDRTDQTKLHDRRNDETYGYDSAHRLTRFERDDVEAVSPTTEAWLLDGAGNPTETDGEAHSYSSVNELVGKPDATLRYDGNGNLIEDADRALAWDYRDRLRRVDPSDGTEQRYSYDAIGRRIIVDSDSGTGDRRLFYYDGWNVLEERDGDNALLSQYVYGSRAIDEPIVLDRDLDGDGKVIGRGDGRYFYHQDDRQSVFALTDLEGTIVEAYQYDAYGYPTVHSPGASGAVRFDQSDDVTAGGTGSVGNPFMFTGRPWDEVTGLYYFRTRYLDPDAGRFISRDSIGVWEDLEAVGNGYVYAGDNPVNLVDPLGTDGFSLMEWLGVEHYAAISGRLQACLDLCNGDITAQGTIVINAGARLKVSDPAEIKKGKGTGGFGYRGQWNWPSSPFNVPALALLKSYCGECDPCCTAVTGMPEISVGGGGAGAAIGIDCTLRAQPTGTCTGTVALTCEIDLIKLVKHPVVVAIVKAAKALSIDIKAGGIIGGSLNFCGDRQGNIQMSSARICGGVFAKAGVNAEQAM